MHVWNLMGSKRKKTGSLTSRKTERKEMTSVVDRIRSSICGRPQSKDVAGILLCEKKSSSTSFGRSEGATERRRRTSFDLAVYVPTRKLCPRCMLVHTPAPSRHTRSPPNQWVFFSIKEKKWAWKTLKHRSGEVRKRRQEGGTESYMQGRGVVTRGIPNRPRSNLPE